MSEELKRAHSTISVHGLLASFLTYSKDQHDVRYDAWRNTWPSMDDFKESMPILWKSSCSRLPDLLLPPTIRDPCITGRDSAPVQESGRPTDAYLLAQQRVRLQRDWNAALGAVPDLDYEEFLYHWLVVNTRCFYYDLPLSMKVRSRDDKMVLCPFIDLFNHADQGVSGSKSVTSTGN